MALLKVTIGYGLGNGYFLALVWVLGFTGIGMLVLRSAPHARDKGPLWRFMASLDHLLPIMELDEEFGEFFHDPQRRWLTTGRQVYFASHALVGYVLASFVVAGLAGLTQAR